MCLGKSKAAEYKQNHIGMCDSTMGVPVPEEEFT